MIFTAYFDEADTHGPAPTVILAAFLGNAYEWARFEKRLGRLQARDSFKVFHAKDFKAKAKEFAGWSDEKCARLVADLTDLVRETLTEGLVVHLERARYEGEYRSHPIPKKMNLDSQYGVCFRACLAHLLGLLAAKGGNHKLNIVMEGGHPNVMDCERIFRDIKMRLCHIGSDVLQAFSIDGKRSCPPLMVGDFLASTYSMMRASKAANLIDYAAVAPEPQPRDAGLTFLELLPDALTGLKEGFEALRRREIEEWHARKAARLALAPSSGRGPS